VLYAADHTYIFTRQLPAERLLMAINAATTSVTLATPDLVGKDTILKPLFQYGRGECPEGQLTLAPRSGLVAQVEGCHQ
jgi:hypothetical protein